MKTKFLAMLVLISMILLSSCNDNLEENQISVSNDDEMNLVQSTTILSFENEAAFLEAVEKLRDSSKLASHLTRSASENDFTAVYPANVKQILLLNNGVGGWEKVKGTFRDALIKLGFSYGSKYVTDWWNEL